MYVTKYGRVSLGGRGQRKTEPRSNRFYPRYFCLESGIVFEGTTGAHGRSFRFNSKELFCLRSNLSNDDLINA